MTARIRFSLVVGLALGLSSLAAAQETAPTGTATGAQAPATDPIAGTKWLGTITAPDETTSFGLEFRQTPAGKLALVVYMPVMHIDSKAITRVTPLGNGEYQLGNLPGTAHVEGNTMRGV